MTRPAYTGISFVIAKAASRLLAIYTHPTDRVTTQETVLGRLAELFLWNGPRLSFATTERN